MNETLKQFIKFGVVGASSAVVDFGILNLLVLIFSVNVYLASTISFILAVTNGYIWNRLWTFQSQGRKTIQYGMFLAVNLVGLGLNLLIMYGLIHYLGLWYNYAKAIAIFLVLFWNYSGSKYWVFKKSRDTATNLHTNNYK